MIDNSTVNVLSTQITLSGLSVLAIQKLKGSSWAPWLNRESDRINTFFSAVLATLAAVGIHLTWSHGAMPGQYMFTVSGVTLLGIASGVWAVTKSLVLNEIIYRGTAKTQLPGKPAQILQASPEATK